MKLAKVQFYPWDKFYIYDITDFNLKPGDKVVAKNDFAIDIGEVKEIYEGGEEVKSIIRVANRLDFEKKEKKLKQKEEVLDYCKQEAEKLALPIKLVDVHFSLEGGCLIFVFVAETRIDFRELVKRLARRFQKSIRMQQIGIRDEAKMVGEIGICGRELCCRKVLKALTNIRSDLVKLQQLENKTSERLSGVCGRLMCCLAYEQETYEECAKDMPAIGEKVEYENKEWEVIAQHILKRSVSLKDTEGMIVEVEIDNLKK